MAQAATKTFTLGGSSSSTTYAYTTPTQKQTASQGILLICNSITYSGGATTTCKAIAQNSASQSGTYSADSIALTYDVNINTDVRMVNGIAKSRWTRIRFAGTPCIPYTTYNVTYTHY